MHKNTSNYITCYYLMCKVLMVMRAIFYNHRCPEDQVSSGVKLIVRSRFVSWDRVSINLPVKICRTKINDSWALLQFVSLSVLSGVTCVAGMSIFLPTTKPLLTRHFPFKSFNNIPEVHLWSYRSLMLDKELVSHT